MNRLIEIAAMFIGGLSVFTVCFVGFVALSGKPMNEVAVIGKLFPAPAEESAGAEGAAGPEGASADAEQAPRNMSDSAVLEASLGVLSAWTLPSPYSTSELRTLSEELKKKRSSFEERERSLGSRERAVKEEEGQNEEMKQTLAELRTRLEAYQQELVQREGKLARAEGDAAAVETARWGQVARVLSGLEDDVAGKRLLEFSPEEAAKVLVTLGDDARAGEILNQVQGPRWKAYVDAYTAERAKTPTKRRS